MWAQERGQRFVVVAHRALQHVQRGLHVELVAQQEPGQVPVVGATLANVLLRVQARILVGIGKYPVAQLANKVRVVEVRHVPFERVHRRTLDGLASDGLLVLLILLVVAGHC